MATMTNVELEELGEEYDALAARMKDLRARQKVAAVAAYESGMERAPICAALRITQPTLSDWVRQSRGYLGKRSR